MAKDQIGKIIARAQERQNRQYKFGEDELGVPLAITLVQDAKRSLVIDKNPAAALSALGAATDVLANIKPDGLRETVLLTCNPPDDCNDPVVLKEYMKACFEKANSKQDSITEIISK